MGLERGAYLFDKKRPRDDLDLFQYEFAGLRLA